MDKDFKNILMTTLKLEGGYTVDHAGATNRGVRQDMYDAYAKANKLPRKNVKDLTYGDVSNFYDKDYYNQFKDVANPRIKGLLFDHAVNAGGSRAVKALQEVVGSKADGKMGKNTNTALNKYIKKNGEDALRLELLQKRVDHYSDLIAKDPETYSKYQDGWFNRINTLEKTYTSEAPQSGDQTVTDTSQDAIPAMLG